MSNFELNYSELGDVRSRVQRAGTGLSDCAGKLRRQADLLSRQYGFGIESARTRISDSASAVSKLSGSAYTIASVLSDVNRIVSDGETRAYSTLAGTEPKGKPVYDIVLPIIPNPPWWSILLPIMFPPSILFPVVSDPIVKWVKDMEKWVEDMEKEVDKMMRITYLESNIGKSISSVADKRSKYYWSRENVSFDGGFDGECTWYAYGRFYEITGIKLKTASHAKDWLKNNRGDPNLTVDGTIRSGSIAVLDPTTAADIKLKKEKVDQNGHVLFVEHVTYNDDGSPKDVYFTEANWGNDIKHQYDREDGLLQKMSYSVFVAKKNIAGYISKK